MKYANVQLNWNTTFQVPVADLSKFLETLGKHPRIKQKYDDVKKEYYDVFETSETPRVDLVNNQAESCERAVLDEQTAGLTD